jgi:hypothetical protein
LIEVAWGEAGNEEMPPGSTSLIVRAALPADKRIETLQMFGGVAAKVNGNLFGGAFGRSVMLLLSEADRAMALALDGAAPFDPMGNGAVRSDKVQMPESIRLATLLAEHPVGDVPETFALLALMHFHGARLAGRVEWLARSAERRTVLALSRRGRHRRRTLFRAFVPRN